MILRASAPPVKDNHDMANETGTSFEHYLHGMNSNENTMIRGLPTLDAEVRKIGRRLNGGGIFLATDGSSQQGKNTYVV